MLGPIGLPELLIILVIVLLIFGAGKLPQIGGNVGKAIKNFKSGVKEKEEQDRIEAEASAGEPIEMEKKREEEKTKV